MMKPFKPPTLLRKPLTGSSRECPRPEPPAKKRRISQESKDVDTPAVIKATAPIVVKTKSDRSFQPPQRDPLVPVRNPNESPAVKSISDRPTKAHYNVLWRKFTTKKNKTWDGDGVLSFDGSYATLRDTTGRELGRGACKGPLFVGSGLSIGGREIEVESVMTEDDILAGRKLLGRTKDATSHSVKMNDSKGQGSQPVQAKHHRAPIKREPRPSSAATMAKTLRTTFKTPLLSNTVLEAKQNSTAPVPRHDPNAEGALVMKRPKLAPRGKQLVDVVVDPLLTKHLREHQRAGVAFMYECVMGMKGYAGEGAILADEMGLGKTLQTIALIWTLLKQNPVFEEAPIIKKVLIVCPVTLINNWRKEFARWLGRERIGVFVAGNKNTRLTDFTLGRAYSVMIIGYEKLRIVQADLQKGPGIDLVIADEGHRLKTAQNKSAQAIKSLNTERRVILSGTPLQNDLTEFYTMVDFVNPGLLNKYSTFKREFEVPILKSRQPEASTADIEKGEARSEELAEITSMFILRRTADILSKYLPPKTEYVVFCKPTSVQAAVYRAIIGSPIFKAALGSPAVSLELINVLKKVCNSPSLLARKGENGEDGVKPELVECIPSHLLQSPGASGKLQVLDSLLHRIRTTTTEKVLIVSNYTSTLDLLARLLTSLAYPFLRLDGRTPASKRQELVDRFNRAPASTCFAFLLSAKAGGAGLNLVGASRCVLFDADWNPATDLQAMARVHRDGQRRPVRSYRLLTRGALDEKIFQRQAAKTGLAARIVDGAHAGVVAGFTRDELRDLFRFDAASACATHALLGCACGGIGTPVTEMGGTETGAEEEEEEAQGKDEIRSRSRDDVEIVRLDEDDALAAEERVQEEETIKQRTGVPGFTSARDFDPSAENSPRGSVDAVGRGKMLGLMQYTHFDPVHITDDERRNAETGNAGQGSESTDPDATVEADTGNDQEAVAELSSLDVAIEDAVLKSVLREEGSRIGYVFAKTSS